MTLRTFREYNNDSSGKIKLVESAQMLEEGGAFGHLSNVWDVDFSFAEMEKIIRKALAGKLDYVQEKTDGQNLLISWKNGRIIAARNKGHLKNRAENAMSTEDVRKKFQGRGLEHSFTQAMIDLERAIERLSEKQRQKIFDEGRKFMSIEVMHQEQENVLHYGVNEVRFHGTLTYNEDGEAIDMNKDEGDILAGMIRQIRADRQETYNIKTLNRPSLPKIPDLDKIEKELLKDLEKVRRRFGLSRSDTLDDYKRKYWEEFVSKKERELGELPPAVYEALVKRWAFFIKQPSIRELGKQLSDEWKKWASDFDKREHKEQYKKMIMPIENVFLKLGVRVLQTMSEFMALNPEKSIQDIKKKVDQAIKQIKSTGDERKMQKLEKEMHRLQSIGGMDAVVPSEGITFIYKGRLLKLTGTFAPINQIVGLVYAG